MKPDPALFPRCPPQIVGERARVLLSCYRKGDAADPEVFYAAVVTVLGAYPEEVVRQVTHPLDGIPGRIQWLPSIAEIKSACDALMQPFYDRAKRDLEERQKQALLAPPAVTPEQRARAVAEWERVRAGMKGLKTRMEDREEGLARLRALGATDADLDSIPDAKPGKWKTAAESLGPIGGDH